MTRMDTRTVALQEAAYSLKSGGFPSLSPGDST